VLLSYLKSIRYLWLSYPRFQCRARLLLNSKYNKTLKNNCKIHPLTSGDLPLIEQIQPDGWPDILPSIKFYCSSKFCFPVKATVNGILAGIGTAIIFGDTAWLGHIIVHKDYRNNGIGTSVTQSLIDLIGKTSCRTVLLIATSLGEPIYKKAGFEVQSQYLFLNDGDLHSAANGAGNIILFEKNYEEALFKLDQEVSGENRKNLFADHWANIYLYIENKVLKGFFISTLGEGLIVAESNEAGIALMCKKYSVNKMFCLPDENEAGINFLTSNGYKEYRKASRMILGNKILWDGSKIYSRIGGNMG
jgi:GNAT superfamily N-acetyltransferase